MRVEFRTDGGFVYLASQSVTLTIDTEDLSAEEADELERLIETARFIDLPETSALPPRGAADYLRYTISVAGPEHSHTVYLAGPIEDPNLQALVEYLEAKSRKSRTTH